MQYLSKPEKQTKRTNSLLLHAYCEPGLELHFILIKSQLHFTTAA
jgi:hypothetical protein